ncbi:alpha-L-fucosidase [Tunicatimonas pelagia]|uniref:alpha-L-fucosidase n=1 Tax=Tunicatimonas pelagia TaxID=931531 RepID=UPI002666877E|nr:alpha-L-fucosidase [Tunicatimonas pelagia]WKN45001.1 alpha-L-fucosidase [Tunicatimonas pelagia]
MMNSLLNYGSLLIVALSFACQSTPTNEASRPAVADTTGILNESSEAFNERMGWWRDARFGMFIHWGPYAVPAGVHQGEEVEGIGEWIMDKASVPIAEYEAYARQFNPTQYDADAWVKLAHNAGMKYLVVTSKHHDGFALWDSEVSQYDVMDFSPFRRDVLAELKAACEKYGVKFCIYYSIMDWHHPQAQAPNYPKYNTRDTARINPEFDQYVQNYLKPQLTELVEQYDPHVLWFDGEWIPDWTHEHGVAMYQYLRELSPTLIINNRIDIGRQGMSGFDAEGDFVGDFGTPEQEIPDTGMAGVDWEACMTMNDTWGYKQSDDNWKSSQELLHKLIDIASKGGNFLLNVGPTAEGLIPEPSVERLQTLGEWLAVNGEAIYGSSASPYEAPDWGRYTQKGGKLYAHVLDWPEGNQLTLPEALTVQRAYWLADGQEVVADPAANALTLSATHQDQPAPVLVIETALAVAQ